MGLDSLRAELELLTRKYQQNELNIKKFDTSSNTVCNLCNVQLAYKDNKGKIWDTIRQPHQLITITQECLTPMKSLKTNTIWCMVN
ncbi:hypothetical protein Hanom_Chr07g00620691 [Helianthus anomalus]